MAVFKGFDGQNWLITPAAPIPYEGPATLRNSRFVVQAVNEHGTQGTAPDPHIISQMQWLLVLSGIAVFAPGNGLGGKFDDVEILNIHPEIEPPLTYAINQTGLGMPPGQSPVFSVEQLAPFCASVVAHSTPSGEGGWVEVWRPSPYPKVTTPPQEFDGVNAQVRVVSSGNQATLRISYTFTLLGRIFYVPGP